MSGSLVGPFRCCFIAGAIALLACGVESVNGAQLEPPYFEHRDLAVELVVGVPIGSPPAIRRPVQVRHVADRLWVLDAEGDPWLHSLDPETGELLFSRGRRGGDLGEFETAFGLGSVPGDPSRIWVHDPSLGRLTLALPEGDVDLELEALALPSLKPITRIAWITPDRLVGLGSGGGSHLTILDPRRASVTARDGPLLGSDAIPLAARVRATYGLHSICPRPGGEGFVVAYGSAGRIELYDPFGRLVGLADVPYPSEPNFELREDRGRVEHVHRRTRYVDCVAAGDRVFALFSGRDGSRFDSAERDSGEFVHAFDGSGRFVTAFRLSHPVRSIAVDVDGEQLFGVSSTGSRVYRFPLPRGSLRASGALRMPPARANVGHAVGGP